MIKDLKINLKMLIFHPTFFICTPPLSKKRDFNFEKSGGAGGIK